MERAFSVPPDAIVVLGCRVLPAARGQLHRRAEVAARAFHELHPRRVIASGGRRWQGVAEATALAEHLVALGVPRSAIVRELWSLTTVENALYTAELLRAESLANPVVVTSDWHVKRALACFDACGVRATALPAPSPDEGFLGHERRRLLEAVRTWVDLSSLPLWFAP